MLPRLRAGFTHRKKNALTASKPPRPMTAALIPPPTDPSRRTRPPANAGNSCYLDAVLVALFADFDGCDGLLNSDSSSSSADLRHQLRVVVNNLRAGEHVTAAQVSDLRSTLIRTTSWYSGKGQHDAAELFACLLDALHAPFVPLVNNLSHLAAHDADADHAPFTERLLWLDLYSRATNDLSTMLDRYFYAEVRHGVRRDGAPPRGVDATVTRSLIPSYTPSRETGEMVSADAVSFATLTLPLAVRRFSAVASATKDRSAVEVPTAIAATSYVNPFANGAVHTLILRSVVCHLGASIKHGHYVTYTYSPTLHWRRWDDMESHSTVRSVPSDPSTGLPEDARWAEQLRRDSYLLLYELVPGDSHPQSGALAASLGTDVLSGGAPTRGIVPHSVARMYTDQQTRRQYETDASLAKYAQENEDQMMALSAQMRALYEHPNAELRSQTEGATTDETSSDGRSWAPTSRSSGQE